ncbi:MAG TPA: ester cyclase, partial [Dehalococcoidia bacterium]|nr:ester cyclase [Dehalococcoidia bacterium]
STGGMVMSPDIIKRVVSLFRGAFPDIVYDIQQIISEGDKVMVHWKAQGTHQGEFRGVSPTGKRITYSGFDLYRMVNGKIVERWGQNDDLGLLEQLGAVSVPPLVR